jgi:hypothetical protein
MLRAMVRYSDFSSGAARIRPTGGEVHGRRTLSTGKGKNKSSGMPLLSGILPLVTYYGSVAQPGAGLVKLHCHRDIPAGSLDSVLRPDTGIHGRFCLQPVIQRHVTLETTLLGDQERRLGDLLVTLIRRGDLFRLRTCSDCMCRIFNGGTPGCRRSCRSGLLPCHRLPPRL